MRPCSSERTIYINTANSRRNEGIRILPIPLITQKHDPECVMFFLTTFLQVLTIYVLIDR